MSQESTAKTAAQRKAIERKRKRDQGLKMKQVWVRSDIEAQINREQIEMPLEDWERARTALLNLVMVGAPIQDFEEVAYSATSAHDLEVLAAEYVQKVINATKEPQE